MDASGWCVVVGAFGLRALRGAALRDATTAGRRGRYEAAIVPPPRQATRPPSGPVTAPTTCMKACTTGRTRSRRQAAAMRVSAIALGMAR